MKTLVVLFCAVFNSAYGFLDLEELKASNFDIEILNNPIVVEENFNDLAGDTMRLASVHGQQYHCVLPPKQTAEVPESSENDKPEIGIPELLNPMQDGPCLILTKGWWTYEFCYRRFIKQYHVEDGKIAGDVMFLGYYETDFDWAANPEKSATYRLNRFHSQQYVNGTVCDMTNKPRRAEVRFLCHEDAGDSLMRVEEAETCVYELYIHTMRLCHHPYLRPARKPPVLTIMCNPLLSQRDYDVFLAQQQEEEEAALNLSGGMLGSNDPSATVTATTRVTAEGVTVMALDAAMTIDENNVDQSAKTLSDLFVQTIAKVLAEEEEALAKKIAATAAAEKASAAEGQSGSDTSSTDNNDAAAADAEAGNSVDGNDVTAKEAGPADDLDAEGGHEGQGRDDDGDEDDEDDDTDKEAVDEFEEGLNKFDPQSRSRLAKYKETIDSFMHTQFGNILDEAEDEVGDIITLQERQAAFQKLTATLNKLMERLAQAQKDTADIDDELERIHKLRAHLLASTSATGDGDGVETDDADESTPSKEAANSATPGADTANRPPGGATEETGNEEGGTKQATNEKVVTKVVNVRMQPSYVSVMQQYANAKAARENAAPSRHAKLKPVARSSSKYKTLKQIDLKKEVKIITAGYYDEEKKVLHLEPTDQSHAFKKILVAVLGFNSDQAVEQGRQEALEEGYNFRLSPQQRRKTSPPQQPDV